LVFPPSVRQVRGPVLDYVTGARREATLDWAFRAVREVITSRQLAKKEVLRVIDKIEEDPLCLPYVSREEKMRKLNSLKKLLTDLVDIEEA